MKTESSHSCRAEPIGVGILGCGKISQAYFDGIRLYPDLRIVACADLNPEVARLQAERNGCEALEVDELLSRPDIGLVLNLTIPAAHAEVSLRVLGTGKHVYCEKPLAVSPEEAVPVLDLAKGKGLRVGCAPDTFLGPGLQACRERIDAGAIGRVVAGTAFMLSPGPESWHPNPGFYYLRGGGPVFDMSPYYLTALVNLLGPVERVGALSGRGLDLRIATSEARRGEKLPVEVDTHSSASLSFVSGAIVTAVFSFDVQAHQHTNIELYGTDGSLRGPDPNTFRGPVELFRGEAREEGWIEQPLGFPVERAARGIGAADMARSIRTGEPHRASGELAFHVLEIMEGIGTSSRDGRAVPIESRLERPAPLPDGLGTEPGES